MRQLHWEKFVKWIESEDYQFRLDALPLRSCYLKMRLLWKLVNLTIENKL